MNFSRKKIWIRKSPDNIKLTYYVLLYNIFVRCFGMSFFRQIKVVTIQTNFQSKRRTIFWRISKLHNMGCCLSKTDENQDKMFDPKGSFPTDSKTESGEYIIRLWPRKDRQCVERIETNKDTIVLSVDPEADDWENCQRSRWNPDGIWEKISFRMKMHCFYFEFDFTCPIPIHTLDTYYLTIMKYRNSTNIVNSIDENCRTR